MSGVGYILGKKIRNYLTEGQPSKIYLMCFVKPQSGYQLAKEIYGQPTTPKIYGWAKKMLASGHLEKDVYGFRASVKPLLAGLEATIEKNGENVDFHERKLLRYALESSTFKKVVSRTYELWKNQTPNILVLTLEFMPIICALNLNLKKAFDIEDVNAVQAWKLIHQKDNIATRIKELDPKVQQFNQIFDSHLEKMGIAKKNDIGTRESVSEDYAEYVLFQKWPNKLLSKVSKLGISSQFLDYMFALIRSLDRVILETEVEELLRRQNRKSG